MSPRATHIGLNLVYLVPGETGGMEVVARELLPALVAAAPDTRFTAFVTREAAGEPGAPWTELVPSITVPVDARNRVQWVRGEQQVLPRLARRACLGRPHAPRGGARRAAGPPRPRRASRHRRPALAGLHGTGAWPLSPRCHRPRP